MSSNKGGTKTKMPAGVWFLVILITTIIAIIGFSYFQPTPKLRMLGSSFSGYSTFRYPAFLDKLKKVQIELSYEDKVAHQEAIIRFNQGEADLIVMTLDQLLLQKPDGKIVGLIDRSVGADGAALNTKRYPDVTTLEKLRSLALEEKGKGQPLKVVYAADSPSEFFLAVLIKNGYNAFKTSFEKLEVSDDREAWNRLQLEPDVVLAILREPYITIAQKNGSRKGDFSTKDEPTKIIDVIVASNSLLQNQPETLSKFLTAYYDRIIPLVLDEDLMQNQIFFQQSFSDSKLSPQAAAEVGKGIHLFTAVEANYWLTSGRLEQQIETIANLLSEAGLLERKPQNPQNLFTAQYIADAVTETNEFCNKLPNRPQAQEFKERVCALTPPSPNE